MKQEKVESLKHLKEILSDGSNHDFFILLNFGLRSYKIMSWDGGDVFYVLNLIDDTEQNLSEAQLMDETLTNIGAAITKGAFFWENWEDENN